MTWGVVVKKRARLRERLQQRAVDRAHRAEAEGGAVTAARGSRAERARASAAAFARVRRVLASATDADRRKPPLAPPSSDYLVFVGSESVDRVALIRFGPKGAMSSASATSGWAPTELAGRTASPCRPTRSTTSCRPRTARRSARLQKYNAEHDTRRGQRDARQLSGDGCRCRPTATTCTS